MSTIRVKGARKCRSGSPAAAIAVLASLLSLPAAAQDTLMGAASVSWWSPQFDFIEEDGTIDAGSVSGAAEVWLSRKWGIRGARFEADLAGSEVESSDHVAIDFKRRFFSVADNGFVGIGAGWGAIDFDNATSSGLRLTAEGRFGLGGPLSFYGLTSWLPELADAGSLSNLQGREFEAGLSLDPDPHLSLRFGFRRFRLDYEEGGATGSAESDGVMFGAGFHW